MERLTQIVVQGGKLVAGGITYDCLLGRGGLSADKREGDLMTPIGRFPMRWCYYRPDRLAPPETGLPLLAIEPDDGWCDDPQHPLYNQPVKLPFDASHEKLWRDDGLYDLIIPLGYNDDPVEAGKGSAIFLHIKRDDGVGTEGCVALAREHVLALLKQVTTQTVVVINAP